MLHAFGSTHVASVGKCRLVPTLGTDGAQRAQHGSLWTEERAVRIRVLNIQDVCDDRIDTLAPEPAPAWAWIQRARTDGGTVLLVCSATAPAPSPASETPSETDGDAALELDTLDTETETKDAPARKAARAPACAARVLLPRGRPRPAPHQRLPVAPCCLIACARSPTTAGRATCSCCCSAAAYLRFFACPRLRWQPAGLRSGAHNGVA